MILGVPHWERKDMHKEEGKHYPAALLRARDDLLAGHHHLRGGGRRCATCSDRPWRRLTLPTQWLCPSSQHHCYPHAPPSGFPWRRWWCVRMNIKDELCKSKSADTRKNKMQRDEKEGMELCEAPLPLYIQGREASIIRLQRMVRMEHI
jgi:hypothetical protein